MAAKVSVSSFVVVELIKSGKMYDESVDLQKIVRSAMDKAATEAGRSLCYVKAEAYTAADAMDRRGTLLEDLPGKSVKDLRDHFGTFLKLHVQYLRLSLIPAAQTGSLTETLAAWLLSHPILRIRVLSAVRRRHPLLSRTVLSTLGLQS